VVEFAPGVGAIAPVCGAAVVDRPEGHAVVLGEVPVLRAEVETAVDTRCAGDLRGT
jgi:hypothetical protein